MRVVLDVNDLRRPQSGIGRYVCGLVMGFQRMNVSNDELLLLHKDTLSVSLPCGDESPSVTAVQVQGRSETLWGQRTLPRFARREKADVIHCPSVRAPMFHRVPVVLTVHDVIFAIHPEWYTRFDRKYMETLYRLVLPRVNRIIAVSDTTSRDLQRYFGVTPDNIDVVHHGIESRFQPRERELAIAELDLHGVKVPQRFFLFVGTLEPRKNIPALCEAYRMIRSQGVDHALVVAGSRGWCDREIINVLDRLALDDAIYLGHVADALLPSLYAAADAVVYPSRYEGFGFPVLEAMASGVPVVTSTADAILEVAGDACLTVPPDDIDGLAHAMRRVVEDRSLRSDLVVKGLARAARFRWEMVAQQTRKTWLAAVERDK